MTDDIDHWLVINATAVKLRFKTAEMNEPALWRAQGTVLPGRCGDGAQRWARVTGVNGDSAPPLTSCVTLNNPLNPCASFSTSVNRSVGMLTSVCGQED